MFDEWYKVAKLFAKQEISIGITESTLSFVRDDDPLH